MQELEKILEEVNRLIEKHKNNAYEYAPNDINRWGVQCKSCGCTVEVEEWKGVEDTKENAIKAWNRRADYETD